MTLLLAGYFGVGAAAGAGAAAMPALIPALGTGAIAGATSGFVGGFIFGTGNTKLGGGFWGEAFLGGLTSGGFGALTGGALAGGGTLLRGKNFWTGNNIASGRSAFALKNTHKIMPEKVAAPRLEANIAEPKLQIPNARAELKSMPNSNTNAVYRGVDSEGVTRYVGITKRTPEVRFGEHLRATGTGKELLDYRVIEGATGLSRNHARIIEQSLIDRHGLQKNGGLLLNKINSISPKKY